MILKLKMHLCTLTISLHFFMTFDISINCALSCSSNLFLSAKVMLIKLSISKKSNIFFVGAFSFIQIPISSYHGHEGMGRVGEVFFFLLQTAKGIFFL